MKTSQRSLTEPQPYTSKTKIKKDINTPWWLMQMLFSSKLKISRRKSEATHKLSPMMRSKKRTHHFPNRNLCDPIREFNLWRISHMSWPAWNMVNRPLASARRALDLDRQDLIRLEQHLRLNQGWLVKKEKCSEPKKKLQISWIRKRNGRTFMKEWSSPVQLSPTRNTSSTNKIGKERFWLKWSHSTSTNRTDNLWGTNLLAAVRVWHSREIKGICEKLSRKFSRTMRTLMLTRHLGVQIQPDLQILRSLRARIALRLSYSLQRSKSGDLSR